MDQLEIAAAGSKTEGPGRDTLTVPGRPRVSEVIEQQGPQECILATIAALAAVPLAEVREMALTAARRFRPGVKVWSDTFGKFGCYRRVVEHVAIQYHLLAVVDHCAADGEGALPLSNKARKLPAIGRGVIRFHKKNSKRGAQGHICPWQDGLIYDPAPAEPKGDTLAEYRVRNFHLRVTFIRQEG